MVPGVALLEGDTALWSVCREQLHVPPSKVAVVTWDEEQEGQRDATGEEGEPGVERRQQESRPTALPWVS